MDSVQMIVIAILIVICHRRDTLVEHFKFRIGFKGLECEISTKQKNDPPSQSDRSNRLK